MSEAHSTEGMSGLQDAVVWNLAYTVTGRRAIFGVFNLWCTLNHVNVKINRICEFPLRASSAPASTWGAASHALMMDGLDSHQQAGPL